MHFTFAQTVLQANLLVAVHGALNVAPEVLEPYTIISYRYLPESCKSSVLHLTQCTTTTNECDSTSRGNGGKQLEKVPGCIVQEESSFDRDQRAEEDRVGNRGGFECGREMVEIDAEEEPLEEDKMYEYQVDRQLRHFVCSTYRNPQNWKGDQSQGQEGKSDGDRWVFGVFLEDVVDFGQLAVSRHLDRRDRFVGVPVD